MTLLLALTLLAAAPDAGKTHDPACGSAGAPRPSTTGAAPSSLTVTGDLVKNATLSLKELQELGAITIPFTDKAGPHQVTGIRLDHVLLRLSFSEGPMGPQIDPRVKHQGLRGVVIATAQDGFVAVFSVGELLETLGATQALLAWSMDGKPLAPDVGPLRLVVPSDKGGSRSLHQLASLKVVSVR